MIKHTTNITFLAEQVENNKTEWELNPSTN
jgi:hypothetical protein